jgi:hypothetical protein
MLMGCVLPVAAQTAASAVVSSGASAAGRSLCAPPADTVGPTITKVTFGKASIDLDSGSRVQTITASATDTSGNGAPSGVERTVLLIRGNRYFAFVKLALTSGTAASGDWTGRFEVSKYARAGTYSIYELSATDAAGNEQDYTGYSKVPDGPNALSLHPADNPTFTVTGTPAKRPVGKPSGKLTAFAFHPSQVDTTSSPRRVHFTAHFNGAAPQRVFVELNSAKKSRHTQFVYLRAKLHHRHGKWSGALRVPQWLGKQTLEPFVNAQYGSGYRPRTRDYDGAKLRRLHAPTKLTVISALDRTRPTLMSLSFAPSSIDSTTGAEKVTVTAKATDTGSGVKNIDVDGGIRHGLNGVAAGLYPFGSAGVGFLSSDSFHVRLKQTSNGDWVGTTTVRQCVPSGTYKLNVTLRDVAGNYHFYSTKGLAKAGITSTVDVTSKHGDVAPPYVYSAATYGADHELFLNFSEGVMNVNTSSMTVYPLSPSSSRYTKPADVSDMTCSNGTHQVDCSGSAGLVTSAVLTVPAFKPGKKYDVFANLNQVEPQLTDGNGNPMQWNDRQAEVLDS